jgi:uncharacterized protein (TIGR01777 family)
MNSFIFRSEFKEPLQDIFDWHMRTGAIERLTPPWDSVINTSGSPSEKGEVHLRVRRGGLPWDMRVVYTDFLRNKFFQDEQVKGPFKHWKHIHRFEKGSDGGSIMEDHIEWMSPFGSLGNFLARDLIETDLRRSFSFRHQRLKNELERIRTIRAVRPLSIGITGSNGLIGRSLCHVLTTSGHQVLRIVRHSGSAQPGRTFWDPSTGEINSENLEGLDAVVNLAGEPLSGIRWTAKKKEEIWQSRVRGTEVLASCLASLKAPPKVLISASAIGFYGDRGADELTENDVQGQGFLPDLCQAWERAAHPAREAGIRVVHPRIGIVLTPSGGVLRQMLPAFRLGVGAKFGDGEGFMSWIDHDDLLSLLIYSIMNDDIEGPVNAVSPHPVSNGTFTNMLGKILSRPAIFSIPDLVTKTFLGEKGTEVVLSSARVVPKAFDDHGFDFKYGSLGDSLSFQLGQ